MALINIRSDFDVDVVDHMGSDASVVKAARVSTVGAKSLDSSSDEGLIRYLMRNRHTSPFEHGSVTFFISAPIFVFREFQRHRTWSYNEESGRYRQLSATVYVPNRDRPLNQSGKVGSYTFLEGTEAQHKIVEHAQIDAASKAFDAYADQLDAGVAREVARMSLPVSTYSSMYATANPRNILQFLELRNAPDAMWEIREVAKQIEEHFAKLYPLTLAAWKEFRNV